MLAEPTLVAAFLTGLLGGVHCAGMCGGIVGALALLGDSGSGGTASGAARRPAVATPLRFVPRRRTSASAPYALSATGGVSTRGTAVPGATREAADVMVDRASRKSSSEAPSGAARGWAYGASSAGARRQLAYNAGRLSSYTLLGAAAGAIGSFGWLYGQALPLQQAAFAATNVLLLAMGLYVAGVRRVGHVLERIGAPLWRHLRPFATASLTRASGDRGALLAGALWGLVPCGMVYAVLAGALLSGGAADGAALMLAFGLGTVPNLLLLGFSAGRLSRFPRLPAVRRAAGGLIGAFGVLGLLRLDVAREIPLLRELCVHLPPFGA